ELSDRIHFLRLAQPLLGLVLRGQGSACAAGSHKAAVGSEIGPAADADMPQPPGPIATAVFEVAERLVPFQRRHMLAPFLRLGAAVDRRLDAALADHGGSIDAEGIQPF